MVGWLVFAAVTSNQWSPFDTLIAAMCVRDPIHATVDRMEPSLTHSLCSIIIIITMSLSPVDYFAVRHAVRTVLPREESRNHFPSGEGHSSHKQSILQFPYRPSINIYIYIFVRGLWSHIDRHTIRIVSRAAATTAVTFALVPYVAVTICARVSESFSFS